MFRLSQVLLSRAKKIATDVLVVGGGPVGLTVAATLSRIGVRCVVVDCASEDMDNRPRAHFMTARTMEILRSIDTRFGGVVRAHSTPCNAWRRFRYTSSVATNDGVGATAGIDHFDGHSDDCAGDDGTSSVSAAHLPQMDIAPFLLRCVDSRRCTFLFGHAVEGLARAHAGRCNTSWIASSVRPLAAAPGNSRRGATREFNGTVRSKYVVACDGANSLVRQLCKIRLAGNARLQSLANVYFTHGNRARPQLEDKVGPTDPAGEGYARMSQRAAMMHFVFGRQFSGVLVALDLVRGQWACQIPFFPPHEDLIDLESSVRHGLLSAAFADGTGGVNWDDVAHGGPNRAPLYLQSSCAWGMSVVVADAYTAATRPCVSSGAPPARGSDVFLAGDAAHQFPPAGGFGMNTGMQDAHNLAWKVAYALNGAALSNVVRSYEPDRRPVAVENATVSMNNWHQTKVVPRALGINPELPSFAARAIDSASNALAPHPWRKSWALRRRLLENALRFGRAQLTHGRAGLAISSSSLTTKWEVVRMLVADHQSLQLLFPSYELDLHYAHRAGHRRRRRGLPEVHAFAGGRFPHAWLWGNRGLSRLGYLSTGDIFSAGVLPDHDNSFAMPSVPRFTLFTDATSNTGRLWKAALHYLSSTGFINVPVFAAGVCSSCEEDENSPGESMFPTFYGGSRKVASPALVPPSGAVLARPDGHVVWQANSPADAAAAFGLDRAVGHLHPARTFFPPIPSLVQVFGADTVSV